MKYYHLSGVSVGLALLQYSLEAIFKIPLSLTVRQFFMIAQAILLGFYTLLVIMLMVIQSKKEKRIQSMDSDQRSQEREYREEDNFSGKSIRSRWLNAG